MSGFTQSAPALLKELTEAHGVSGSEDAVRRIFLRELEGHGKVLTDRLGSAAVERTGGPEDAPRVLVAGHFDEVGFAVQNITPKGYLKLVALGGWWTHTLVAQRVRVLTASGQEFLGVVGSTPPHFLGESAKDKVLPLEQLYVDIGATSRAEAQEWGVALGDAVAPDSAFTALPNGRFLAKAFDNRCGVAAAIQTMQSLKEEALPCRLIAAGSVQEEVGCRGAVTLAALTKPDVALVMEGTPADDTPGMPADDGQGALGSGVQIRVLDPTALMNRRLVDLVVATAKAEGIPHQVAVRRSGGTDAKSFQFHETGVPCIVLGTPARYIHSHNSLLHLEDYLSAVWLTAAVVKRLDVDTVAELTRWT
jgi:putative aminopeptidase FrvX